MIPKLVHQTAPRKQLSPEEGRMVARAARMLPGWHFRLWDDADNKALVAEHFPELSARFNAIGRGVVQADIARCVYLHAFGGFYFDTDYKLLRPFEDALLESDCLLPISRDDDLASPEFRVCNSIIASVRGYPLWADFVRHLFEQNVERLTEGAVEKVTGPEGLTAFVLANMSRYPGIRFARRREFHPLITRRGLSFDRSYPSYGAHLCWGSWRSKSPLRAAKTLLVRKVTSFT